MKEKRLMVDVMGHKAMRALAAAEVG